jgi:hypothetical protein
MEYLAMATFNADGKTIQRGTVLKGKQVAKWTNYLVLEAAGYIRRIEDASKE